MIVVDTNLIAYLYINGEYSEQAEKICQKDSQWSAPLIWRSEFRNILMRWVRNDYFGMDTALRIMGEAEILLKDREFVVKSDEVLKLASSASCSVHDAEFVWLAREMGAPLITVDPWILQTFPETARSPEQFFGEVR
jgi:predicted nucleic acid-binding protein